MYQCVHLIGRLGKDPELRYTASQKPVANFTVATSEGKDKTEWHNIIVWEKQAENCKEYLHKGSMVAIQGRITTREYEGKDGSKRHTTEIVAHTVKFLSSKSDGGEQQPARKSSSPPPQEMSLDDIPF